MEHVLPDLPYDKRALEPHVSAETLEFHHGKHHAAYVAQLNDLIKGTEFADKSLEDIVKSAPAGALLNNAAQAWNHAFYWNCMSPSGGGAPRGALAEAINASFGDVAGFKEKFSAAAKANFGSGWTWLVTKADGTLDISNTGNAGCPLTEGVTPLLTLDVWEHAYYIDYRNARPQYIDAFWHIVNWDFAAKNLG